MLVLDWMLRLVIDRMNFCQKVCSTLICNNDNPKLSEIDGGSSTIQLPLWRAWR